VERGREKQKKRREERKERRQRRNMEPRIKVLMSVRRGAESRVVYCYCIGLEWLIT
jgi:hypothetical protein